MTSISNAKALCRARTAAVVCCVWMSGGCVQGPDYVKPVVDVPPAYRFADQSLGVVQQPAWWSAYGDVYLNRLVQETLATHAGLRIATARIDDFAAILAGTKPQASPQIGYGASGNRSRTSEDKIPDLLDPY